MIYSLKRNYIFPEIIRQTLFSNIFFVILANRNLKSKPDENKILPISIYYTYYTIIL